MYLLDFWIFPGSDTPLLAGKADVQRPHIHANNGAEARNGFNMTKQKTNKISIIRILSIINLFLHQHHHHHHHRHGHGHHPPITHLQTSTLILPLLLPPIQPPQHLCMQRKPLPHPRRPLRMIPLLLPRLLRIRMYQRRQRSAIDHQPTHKGSKLRRRE